MPVKEGFRQTPELRGIMGGTGSVSRRRHRVQGPVPLAALLICASFPAPETAMQGLPFQGVQEPQVHAPSGRGFPRAPSPPSIS
jgi:hypothetical protein